MPRPTLKLKPKAAQKPADALPCPKCDGWLAYRIHSDDHGCVKCDYTQPLDPIEPVTVTHQEHRYPEDWVKGQLLNVRRFGDNFVLTVLGEEFDPQHPERALHFNNSYDCQSFVSWFYARDNHDPRAG